MKKQGLGAEDLVEAATRTEKMEESAKLARLEQARKAMSRPFPEDVRTWNVEDVARWLDTLTLGQYKRAFEEAAVDGPFLLELREEDLRDVLGVVHTLHVRKIMLARDKVNPLSAKEERQLATIQDEDGAAAARGEDLMLLGGKRADTNVGDVPEKDVVFSQVRHSRLRRLKESLENGFPIETEDEHGNTVLLFAAQNVNKRIIEMLLDRGANVNHQNKQGNTALHYAMSYDVEGSIGELLIDRGADDTLTNTYGLSPYDGISPDAGT
jgi:hypothetical protein